ncbi:hypothetical protein RhiirA5_416779 [Rhizophagus irregularis]|uniref:Uncharacterized protein n=2 Tax=Rhizophagus irregularis TaxID=588596 RepID=A0A2I1FBA2_9GLOM|nr:hypothetical protein RhiirA5_416779 [Rhizophagus irregularis]PKY31664.1 hypothetical protein RhiirB3_449377 [Rhizophagus irregularis]GBC12876.1 hypothetical protein GLOIN_2v1791036 [Rhizophagus irregularis DAOM 181602=DAOM 197198]
MEDIKVGTDNVDNIICLSFYSVSNRIAKELSLKEKANHEKKLKEKLFDCILISVGILLADY